MLSNAYGQDITFKNISINQGLSSNLVYNANQGPDGLLWIIANYRLESYNEGKVTNYTNDIIPNIEDYRYADFMIDESNIIWLRSTNKELLYLDQNRSLNRVDNDEALPNGILNFLQEENGRIDFIANKGHFHYDIEKQKIDTIHIFEEPIFSTPALQISYEGSGLHVINVRGKVILYDSNTGRVNYVFDQVRSHGAAMIDERQMLVSTSRHHELFLVDIVEDKIIKNLASDIAKKYPQTNTYYRRIKHLDSDHIGITSGHQGLFILNVHDFSVNNYAHDFANPSSISSDNSYFLYANKNGNVFVTSRTSGLNIFNPGRRDATHIKSLVDHKNNTIFEGHISYLAKDRSGNFWMASSQGLLKYDPKTNTADIRAHEQENDEILSITSLYIDEKDRICLGVSGGGLEVFDTNGDILKVFRYQKGNSKSLKNNFIYSMTTGYDGKLWIGTSRGINRIDLNELKIIPPVSDEFFEELNTAIREIKTIGEETFVGTWRKGGYVIFENTLKRIEIPEKFEAVQITAFDKDKTGKLYVGSHDGLFTFSYDKAENKYAFIEEVMKGRILSIDSDRSGDIWVSVENILYKFQSNGNRVEEFTKANGFTGGGFRMGGSYKDREGLLYYGMNTGMCYFDPDDLGRDETKLNPFITGVFKDDKKMLISRNENIDLSFEENNIGIYYENIDIWNNPIIQYQYSVSQSQEEWTSAITNPILIQNIDPGTYEIKIRASRDGEYWVNSSNHLSLKVGFPWWRSWVVLCFDMHCIGICCLHGYNAF